MLLRCFALAGLIVFFLAIERRTTREVVHNSQVAVLVDVSQSMGLGEYRCHRAKPAFRAIKAVVDAFANSPLIGELRKTHDVNVARFDEDVEPVVSLPKSGEPGRDVSSHRNRQHSGPRPSNPRPSTRSTGPQNSNRAAPKPALVRRSADELRLYHDAPLAGRGRDFRWCSERRHRARRGRRSGPSGESAALHDRRRFGGRPAQHRASAISSSPTRAFPNDTLNVTGYLQANGYAGQSVDVELTRRRTQDPAGGGTPDRSATRRARALMAKWRPSRSISNQARPAHSFFSFASKRRQTTATRATIDREAEIEVVDRKTRVLLFASGPMRDYQFLRNQLHRDPTMIVDVLLQTAQPGISQDANKILDHFPSTAEELYQYDCIVAFDPDWTKLDAAQVELVEKWVSEEAGGLIAIAGPIQTPHWIRSTEHAKLRDLYPVVFQNRMTLMDDGQYRRRNSVAAGDGTRRPRSQVSLARQNGRRERSRLGQLSRRVRLTTP